MAAVPILITGVMKDNDSEEEKQVTITGLASIAGLGVGGGPILGGGGAHPEHPIFFPPVISGPPGPWPSPPIANVPGVPGSPDQPPGGGGEPPKFDVKVGWTPETGWVVVLVPGEGTLVPTPSKK
jgi:hypothetical protein